MNKTCLLIAALFFLSLPSSPLTGSDLRPHFNIPDETASVDLIRHLEPGMEYVLTQSFSTYYDASRSCFRIPDLPYLKKVFMTGNNLYQVVLGPFEDGRACLMRIRTEFCPSAVIIRPSAVPSPVIRKPALSFEQSVIEELEPGEEYIQIGAYTNEDEARAKFKSSRNSRYDISVYKSGDRFIRLLCGPITDSSQHLCAVRKKFSGDAFIRNGPNPSEQSGERIRNIQHSETTADSEK